MICFEHKLLMIIVEYSSKNLSFFQHPWAMLIMKYEDSLVHCSGSLISNKFGLSAGHCFTEDVGPFDYVPLNELSLFFGVNDVNQVTGSKALWKAFKLQRRLIKNVITHHRYQWPQAYFDISIIGKNCIFIVLSCYITSFLFHSMKDI